MAVTTNDSSIKFGWRYGGHQGVSVPASTGDYVNRLGGAFVKVTGGTARIATESTTTVDGWLEMPKETTQGESVQLDSNDYFVITDPTAVFELPVDESAASLAQTSIGDGCLCAVSGSGTTAKQKAKLSAGTCATPILLIEDVDLTNKSVYVRMNPAKRDVT